MRALSCFALGLGLVSAFVVPAQPPSVNKVAAQQQRVNAVILMKKQDMTPAMAKLSALLVKAQKDAKFAKTPIQKVNAQETVDALADRIEKQEWLEKQQGDLDALVLERLKKLADGKFPVETESWKQIDMHEL